MDLQNLIDLHDVYRVFEVLSKHAGSSRFVGGCVRNALLNLPIDDIDIATTLRPDQVESAFSQEGIKIIDIGKDYGTIIVVINSCQYEITTLRKDVETDGRRAVVEYCDDWQEDALRRDLTINAMSYDPREQKLYDYFGGIGDLENGMIKFVGNPEQRVQEDYLRILRFFRFYTYYGKIFDEDSLRACAQYAEKIQTISAERKFHEFSRILQHNNSSRTLKIMLENQVLYGLFAIKISDGTIQVLDRLKELSKDLKHSHSYLLKFFAIIHTNNIDIDAVNETFKFSNKDKQYLMNIKKIVDTGITKIQQNLYEYIYEQKDLLDGLLFLKADHETFNEAMRYSAKSLIFPITGADIMSHFAVKEGKEVGKLLDLAKKIWFKSKYSMDKEEILASCK